MRDKEARERDQKAKESIDTRIRYQTGTTTERANDTITGGPRSKPINRYENEQ